MERKKHRLLVLLIILSSVVSAQTDYQKKIYEAFILNEMDGWKSVIDEMEEKSSDNHDLLDELINYEYGYIGWCIGNNQKKQAKYYLDLMEGNLETFNKNTEESALYNAYTAAVYGFKIGLSTWHAPFLGPKSVKHAEIAFKKDSLNFQANAELGNIWHHMPAVFGGSDEKALSFYNNAIKIYESSEQELHHKKWLYLNLIATSGKIEFEQKNYTQALHLYKKALRIEPKFKWVLNELLPELKKDMN